LTEWFLCMDSENPSPEKRLEGKKILLGITGSIAAYKSVYLCRFLVKEGAEVRIIMTPSATQFVRPVTFATLSKNPVRISLAENDEWSDHVEWGLWSDAFLIAPLTANTLAKMATGMADNMLLATYLSCRSKIIVAPAMDLDMWHHPATCQNLETILSRGVMLIDVVDGELASGLQGPGRMAEPEDILEYTVKLFSNNKPLQGKSVLVTAGPTRESIDPVRYLTNHSSGKMGFALANALADAGASVQLVHGPVDEEFRLNSSIKKHPVVSAEEMLTACNYLYEKIDIAIFAAAVSDYKPEEFTMQKIKKEDGNTLVLRLKKNPDIAAELGKIKKNKLHIGFALETENEIENARKKLQTKKFDMVVLNSLADEGSGFGYDTNKVTFVEQNNILHLELKPKAEVAKDIVNYIVKKL